MRKALFLLITLLFVQCKSDQSYNSVVNEAIKTNEKNVPIEGIKADVVSIDSSDIQEVENEAEVKEIEENTSDKEVESLGKKVEATKPAPKKRSKPIISFDNYIYQFGKITEGDIIKHKFYFTNIGKTSLNIKSSSATCGCTIPSYPFIPIEPGEQGYIGVTYNSVSKSGKQAPVITVVSNASEPIIKLRMTGEVVEKEEDLAKSQNPDSTEILPH